MNTYLSFRPKNDQICCCRMQIPMLNFSPTLEKTYQFCFAHYNVWKMRLLSEFQKLEWNDMCILFMDGIHITESMNGYVIFKRVMIVITEKGEYEKTRIIYVEHTSYFNSCSSFLWCGLFSFLNDFFVCQSQNYLW